MIACALRLGISKRALFEDYYWDEFLAVTEAWFAPPDTCSGENAPEVGAEEF